VYLILKLLDSRQEDIRFRTEYYQAFPPLIFSQFLGDLLVLFPNVWTRPLSHSSHLVSLFCDFVLHAVN